MTPQRVVIDTDIVIDLLKKVAPTVDRFLAPVASEVSFLVSPVVVAEVYAGAFEREHKDIESFFNLCQHIVLDHHAGRLAGHYANRCSKAFQEISLEDYLLAGTARALQCPLWTHNRKHYPMDDIELLSG